MRALIALLFFLLSLTAASAQERYEATDLSTSDLAVIVEALCDQLPDHPLCPKQASVCRSARGDVCECAPGNRCVSGPASCACTSATASLGGPSGLSSGLPPLPLAEIDIECGSKTYTLKTGTSSGSCKPAPFGGSCTDGDNTAGVNCEDGCTGTTGAGSCKLK